MARSSTTFTKGRKVTPRGKAKTKPEQNITIEIIRDLLPDGEAAYIRKCVELSMGDENNKPNSQLMALVMQRIQPPLKTFAPLVRFEFDKELSYRENAFHVFEAISSGKLAPDIGAQLISGLFSIAGMDKTSCLRSDVDKANALLDGEIPPPCE